MKNLLKWITDPTKRGTLGEVEYTIEEDSFAKLFVCYLNCRYPLSQEVEAEEFGEQQL